MGAGIPIVNRTLPDPAPKARPREVRAPAPDAAARRTARNLASLRQALGRFRGVARLCSTARVSTTTKFRGGQRARAPSALALSVLALSVLASCAGSAPGRSRRRRPWRGRRRRRAIPRHAMEMGCAWPRRVRAGARGEGRARRRPSGCEGSARVAAEALLEAGCAKQDEQACSARRPPSRFTLGSRLVDFDATRSAALSAAGLREGALWRECVALAWMLVRGEGLVAKDGAARSSCCAGRARSGTSTAVPDMRRRDRRRTGTRSGAGGTSPARGLQGGGAGAVLERVHYERKTIAIWAPGTPGVPDETWRALVARTGAACEGGDAEACLHASKFAEEGVGRDRDREEAKALTLRACTLGGALACAVSAIAIRDTDVEGARALYRRACTLGDGYACSALARRRDRSGPRPSSLAAGLRPGPPEHVQPSWPAGSSAATGSQRIRRARRRCGSSCAAAAGRASASRWPTPSPSRSTPSRSASARAARGTSRGGAPAPRSRCGGRATPAIARRASGSSACSRSSRLRVGTS